MLAGHYLMSIDRLTKRDFDELCSGIRNTRLPSRSVVQGVHRQKIDGTIDTEKCDLGVSTDSDDGSTGRVYSQLHSYLGFFGETATNGLNIRHHSVLIRQYRPCNSCHNLSKCPLSTEFKKRESGSSTDGNVASTDYHVS